MIAKCKVGAWQGSVEETSECIAGRITGAPGRSLSSFDSFFFARHYSSPDVTTTTVKSMRGKYIQQKMLFVLEAPEGSQLCIILP